MAPHDQAVLQEGLPTQAQSQSPEAMAAALLEPDATGHQPTMETVPFFEQRRLEFAAERDTNLNLLSAEQLTAAQRNLRDERSVTNEMILQRLSNRNHNTKKAYRKGQAMWIKWCARKDCSDGVLVRGPKLLLFLREEVITIRRSMSQVNRRGDRAGARKRAANRRAGRPIRKGPRAETCQATARAQKDSGTGADSDDDSQNDSAADSEAGHCERQRAGAEDIKVPLHPDTVESSYVSALVSLWNDQSVAEENPFPNPRTVLVKTLLAGLRIEWARLEREAGMDRGIGGLRDGYSMDQFEGMSRALLQRLNGSVQEEKCHETRLELMLLHSMMLRSETTRNAELADLEHLVLPEEGSDCWAVILRQSEGKTLGGASASSAKNRHYHGFMRHRNALRCPVGALAFWFVYRWDLSNESPPDFTSPAIWPKTKILPVSLLRPMDKTDSSTQYVRMRKVFDEQGIVSSQVLHAPRKSVARFADVMELSVDQIGRAGGWERGALSTSYLSHLSRPFMRVVAGHPQERGGYVVNRAVVTPPAALLRAVMPWVDVALRRSGKSRDSGRRAVTQHAVLELLSRLKTVFLQDAVTLQAVAPHLRLWGHPVFRRPEWSSFAAQVHAANAVSEPSLDERLAATVPVIAQKLQSIDARIAKCNVDSVSAIRSLATKVDDQLRDLGSRVHRPERRGIPRLTAVTHHYTTDDAGTSADSIDVATTLPQSRHQAHQEPPLRPLSPNPPPLPAVHEGSYATRSREPAVRPEGWPVNPLTTSMETMNHVWREWHNGLNDPVFGKLPSILELEKRFKHKWRYDNRVKRQHTERKKLIHAFLHAAKSLGCEVADLLNAADELRLSPDKIKRGLYERSEADQPLIEFLRREGCNMVAGRSS